jgi:nucleoside phosphorylase
MDTSSRRRLPPEDYTVALICPMGVELAAMQAMLDEIHEPIFFQQCVTTYTLGTISSHNAVIAVLPYIGNNCAAILTAQLGRDFPSIKVNLLVGIGGGVPSKKHDIRLGDVIVSKPIGTSGGVIQVDMGKIHTEGRFERTGSLGKPPRLLLAAVEKIIANHKTFGSQLPLHLSKMIKDHPNMLTEGYTYQDAASDVLFPSDLVHQGGESCDKSKCDLSQLVKREPREDSAPRVFYGTIGSSNAVIKDAKTRDQLAEELGVLCLEMEAAGMMDELPCLVIRGVCDYADSHKNKQWQPYASATAAAYAKELLSCIPAQSIGAFLCFFVSASWCISHVKLPDISQ